MPPAGRGHGSALSPSIVAGSARGWESLKRVHPALWQISPWMPNPRHRRSARIARPACAALRRYTGRDNRPPARGSRCFRLAGIVSRSWRLLLVVVSAQTTRSGVFVPVPEWWCCTALPDDLLQQRMELCSFDGLLQHRRVRELRDDGIGPVAGHEREWDFPAGQDVRNRIGLFAP